MISKLKLQLRASIILVHFQPIFILWTFIFELFGAKKSLNFYIYLILFSLLIFWLFVVNSPNISGGISYLHGFMLLFFWVCIFFYIFHLIQRNSEILFLCYFLYFCLFVSFFITYFFFNDLVMKRQVIYIFAPFVDATTTGYINIMTMITSVLMFLKRPLFPLVLFITLITSFIWLNRTGVGLCLVMGVFYLKDIKIISLRAFFIISFVIFFITFFSEFVTQSSFTERIYREGFQSLRWVMMIEALNSLLNGENLMGGFKSNLINARPWIHNGFLDLYRVGGIIPLFIAVIFFLVSLNQIIKKNDNLLNRYFLWIVGFIIFNTSVAFEGFIYESIFILILIFNSLFLNMSYNKTDFK